MPTAATNSPLKNLSHDCGTVQRHLKRARMKSAGEVVDPTGVVSGKPGLATGN